MTAVDSYALGSSDASDPGLATTQTQGVTYTGGMRVTLQLSALNGTLAKFIFKYI